MKDPKSSWVVQPKLTEDSVLKAQADSKAPIARGGYTNTMTVYKKGEKEMSLPTKLIGIICLVRGFIRGGYGGAMASYWYALGAAWMAYAVWTLGTRSISLPPVQRATAAAGLVYTALKEGTKDA